MINVTYPRIDHRRGLALQVQHYRGEKVCAAITLRPLPMRLVDPPAPPIGPLAGFLLDSHRSLCLSTCLRVIRDHWPRATQPVIHRAMVLVRRVLEGGGTVRSAVYHALNQLEPPPAA